MKNKLVLLFALITLSAKAQQQLLTVDQCEDQFRKNNLSLIAEQFNIDAARAGVVQAKIWQQPYFTAEINGINPSKPTVFSIGANGQKSFSVQQLIYLGHKKQYEVEVAKSNVDIAALQFEDVLRNLRYQMRQSFYTIYFEQKQVGITDRQLANLDTLIAAYSVQAAKGNVALKDVVRLQSLYFNLKNDKTALIKDITEQQQTLRLITGLSTDVNPNVENLDAFFATQNPALLTVDGLTEKALAARPDYLLTKKNIENNQWQVKWQKSLAVPDLTAGISYDQNGGAFRNQVDFTFGIPLPLWNSNKGNIQAAEVKVKQAQTYQDFAALQIRNEVVASLSKWHQAYDNYIFYTKTDIKTFDQVYSGVMQNFQKRNISIMDFTDFMESYNQSIQQFNEITKNLLISCEDLNKTVHAKIF